MSLDEGVKFQSVLSLVLSARKGVAPVTPAMIGASLSLMTVDALSTVLLRVMVKVILI